MCTLHSYRKEDEEINNKEKMTNHSSRSLIESQSIDASEIKKETPEYSSTQHSNDVGLKKKHSFNISNKYIPSKLDG